MSYFSKFPEIIYDLTKPGSTVDNIFIAKDIIRRVKLKENLSTSVFAYDEYDIQEGERPDILAHQFYNDAELAWIILLTNEIHDVLEEWPRTENELRKVIAKKYENPESVHHYERPQASGDATIMVQTTSQFYTMVTGVGVTQSFASVAVTNRQYEQRENEKKRRIKILRSSLVQEFIEEFNNLIGD
jgi:hypothetical protein